MRKITAKISGLLAIALIVGSCARDNSVVSNGRFQKRKHTGGYHLDWNKKYKTEKEEAIDREKIAVLEEKQKVEEIQIETPTEAISLNETKSSTIYSDEISNPIESNENSSFNETQTEVLSPKANQAEDAVQTPISSKKELKNLLKETKKSMKQQDKNAPLPIESIVYILLCIFIPFVAVGLATDWEVKDVVINLLLCLLCGIPGMIHAFIVCNREGVI